MKMKVNREEVKEGPDRVFRGGSWYYYSENCHSANRFRDSLKFQFDDMGLRLVIILEDEDESKMS